MNQSNLPSVLNPLCPALVMNIIPEAGLLISGQIHTLTYTHTNTQTSYCGDMDQIKTATDLYG